MVLVRCRRVVRPLCVCDSAFDLLKSGFAMATEATFAPRYLGLLRVNCLAPPVELRGCWLEPSG